MDCEGFSSDILSKNRAQCERLINELRKRFLLKSYRRKRQAGYTNYFASIGVFINQALKYRENHDLNIKSHGPVLNII